MSYDVFQGPDDRLLRSRVSKRSARFLMACSFISLLVFQSPAHATLSISTSQTVSADHTAATGTAPATAGSNGISIGATGLTLVIDANIAAGPGGDGANGGANNASNGGYGYFDTFGGNNLTINTLKQITAGSGGNGGNGAASAGGNGGNGRNGLFWGGNNNVASINGTVRGGNGGNGGTGDGGAGGNGGTGDSAFYAFGTNSVNNITGFLYGGNGGNGGAALNGNFSGGTAGTGGNGFSFITSTITMNLSGTSQGGNGGNGGNSSGTGANRNGGSAGDGIFSSNGGTLNVLSGGIAQGGNGGAAGTGGSGGSTAGNAGRGIEIFNGAMTINVSSGGIIRGGSSGNAEGEGIYSAVAITSLNNAGLIEQGINSSLAINSASSITDFVNSGTIGKSSSSASAVRFSGTITNFTNSGSILSGSGTAFNSSGVTNFRNSGTISSQTGSAVLFTSGAMDNTLDNTGGILTSGVTSATAGTFQSNLTLGGKTLIGGTVQNTHAGGNAFYTILPHSGYFTLQDVTVMGNINGGSNAQEYEFTGNTSLNGDMNLGIGANRVLLNGNYTGASDVDFMATGGTIDFAVGSSGVVTLNGIQESANNIATFDVASGGAITLNESFTASGLLTNNGRINLGQSDVLTVGNMAAGAAGNSWQYVLSDFASVPRLVVGGSNAVNFTNSTIHVDASSLLSTVPVGSSFLIADGGSAAVIDVANGTAVQDNSVLLSFMLYRGDAAGLSISGADASQVYLISDLASLRPYARTSFQDNIASVIDDVTLAGALLDVQAIFASKSDAGEISDLLDQIVPQSLDPVSVENSVIINDVAGLMYSRLVGQRGASAAADDLPSRFWVQTFGNVSAQGSIGDVSGYNSRSRGVSFGFDTTDIFENSVLGAAISYGSSDAHVKNSGDAKVSSDNFLATIYGDYNLTPDVYFEGLVSGGFSLNNSQRYFADQPIIADYDSKFFNVQGRINYAVASQVPWFTVVPYIGANYIYNITDAYSEKGVGALEYEDVSANTLSFSVGGRAQVEYDLAGSKLLPYVDAGFGYDVIHGDNRQQVQFVGAGNSAGFKLAESSQGPASLSVGAGVDFYTKDQLQLTVDYDFETRDDYKSHGGFVRASYRF